MAFRPFAVMGAVALTLAAAPLFAYEESTEVYESHESTTKRVEPVPPPTILQRRSTVEEEYSGSRPSDRVIEQKRTIEVPPPVVRERKTETETIEK